jgi:hypothetical protein
MTNPNGAITHDGDGDRSSSDGTPDIDNPESEPPPAARSTGDQGDEDCTGDQAATDAEGGDQDQLSLDVIFEILKNSRRRQVLDHVEDRNEPVDLGDLAEVIAARENDTTVDGITSQERKRVYVGLYQAHLPKMADVDIVRYDRTRGQVELADNAEQLVQYRNAGPTPRRRWYRYYAAIAAGGTVLFAASVTSLAPDAAVPLTLAAVLAALVGCSLVHVSLEGGADA